MNAATLRDVTAKALTRDPFAHVPAPWSNNTIPAWQVLKNWLEDGDENVQMLATLLMAAHGGEDVECMARLVLSCATAAHVKLNANLPGVAA